MASRPPGRLIAVVGPSGVGKDSAIAGIVAKAPWLKLVHRSITRAPDLGGEDYDAITVDAFHRAIAQNKFALHWEAHGLLYGIPATALHDVRNGEQCIANLSRAALEQAASVFPAVVVLNLTASAEVLAARLAHRGRETRSDIQTRLSRQPTPFPDGLDIVTLTNEDALEDTVDAALAALQKIDRN